jgi:molybdopterin/thiamine biosynthesis adenylyltransferase
MNISDRTQQRALQPSLHDGAQIKIIGLGGVGGIVARYGALFLASLQRDIRLVLIDGDAFEPSNANRMFFGAFGNKAQVMLETMLPRFAESRLSLVAIEDYINPENIGRLIQERDLVLLTVDNHATRKLVSDHCSQLRDVCLISGGNDAAGADSAGTLRSGTFGNVQIYLREQGLDRTPALNRFHPEIEKPADRLPTDKSCTELVTSVPQILFANLAVASAMLNTLWLHLCGALHYTEVVFDIAEARMRPALPMQNHNSRNTPNRDRLTAAA